MWDCLIHNKNREWKRLVSIVTAIQLTTLHSSGITVLIGVICVYGHDVVCGQCHVTWTLKPLLVFAEIRGRHVLSGYVVVPGTIDLFEWAGCGLWTFGVLRYRSRILWTRILEDTMCQVMDYKEGASTWCCPTRGDEGNGRRDNIVLGIKKTWKEKRWDIYGNGHLNSD